MLLRDAYIIGCWAFLSGEPVGNTRIEDFIGRIGNKNSVLGRRALVWNGVQTRHYA